MDFDFYREYARYSNVELLRMLHSAHQYQPAAIEAVRTLRSGRNVTEEEERAAQESLQPGSMSTTGTGIL